jgi:hypothetical protein
MGDAGSLLADVGSLDEVAQQALDGLPDAAEVTDEVDSFILRPGG